MRKGGLERPRDCSHKLLKERRKPVRPDLIGLIWCRPDQKRSAPHDFIRTPAFSLPGAATRRSTSPTLFTDGVVSEVESLIGEVLRCRGRPQPWTRQRIPVAHFFTKSATQFNTTVIDVDVPAFSAGVVIKNKLPSAVTS